MHGCPWACVHGCPQPRIMSSTALSALCVHGWPQPCVLGCPQPSIVTCVHGHPQHRVLGCLQPSIVTYVHMYVSALHCSAGAVPAVVDGIWADHDASMWWRGIRPVQFDAVCCGRHSCAGVVCWRLSADAVVGSALHTAVLCMCSGDSQLRRHAEALSGRRTYAAWVPPQQQGCRQGTMP